MLVHVEVSRETDSRRASQEVSKAVREVLNTGPIDLAFLFFSPHFSEDVETIVKTIQEELAPRVLLGCMGEGVIAKTEEFEELPVVTLWAATMPNVELVPFHLHLNDEGQEGDQLRGWPDQWTSEDASPTVVMLADPFSTPVEEFFAQMDQRCPGAPAIGGVASGGQDVGENRLILNGKVLYGGVVGVAISGAISIRTVVSQGCKPIGERYVVTKADRNIVYELGGLPTLERLQATLDLLGSEGGRKAALALQLGVAFDEHQANFDRGDFLIRGLIGADQNSGGVAVSDIIKEGQTVQFHLRDAQAASEELNLLLAKSRVDFADETPKGVLLFSCNGRGRNFFNQPHHDIETVLNRTGEVPVAGFFAGGEIGPVGGQNFIHGYTASIAIFSEPARSSS
jgi:small ligand-binding sensory domain FIST